MPRRPDTLKVEIIDTSGRVRGVLENFTSFKMILDITQPSEASFELGDDGTAVSLGRDVAPGTDYRVFVNDPTSGWKARNLATSLQNFPERVFKLYDSDPAKKSRLLGATSPNGRKFLEAR